MPEHVLGWAFSLLRHFQHQKHPNNNYFAFFCCFLHRIEFCTHHIGRFIYSMYAIRYHWKDILKLYPMRLFPWWAATITNFYTRITLIPPIGLLFGHYIFWSSVGPYHQLGGVSSSIPSLWTTTVWLEMVKIFE